MSSLSNHSLELSSWRTEPPIFFGQKVICNPRNQIQLPPCLKGWMADYHYHHDFFFVSYKRNSYTWSWPLNMRMLNQVRTNACTTQSLLKNNITAVITSSHFQHDSHAPRKSAMRLYAECLPHCIRQIPTH